MAERRRSVVATASVGAALLCCILLSFQPVEHFHKALLTSGLAGLEHEKNFELSPASLGPSEVQTGGDSGENGAIDTSSLLKTIAQLQLQNVQLLKKRAVLLKKLEGMRLLGSWVAPGVRISNHGLSLQWRRSLTSPCYEWHGHRGWFRTAMSPTRCSLSLGHTGLAPGTSATCSSRYHGRSTRMHSPGRKRYKVRQKNVTILGMRQVSDLSAGCGS